MQPAYIFLLLNKLIQTRARECVVCGLYYVMFEPHQCVSLIETNVRPESIIYVLRCRCRCRHCNVPHFHIYFHTTTTTVPHMPNISKRTHIIRCMPCHEPIAENVLYIYIYCVLIHAHTSRIIFPILRSLLLLLLMHRIKTNIGTYHICIPTASRLIMVRLLCCCWFMSLCCLSGGWNCNAVVVVVVVFMLPS